MRRPHPSLCAEVQRNGHHHYIRQGVGSARGCLVRIRRCTSCGAEKTARLR